ncbi:MAG: InlB B-repeat-containing protein [Hungatella sp.]|nr:InlB B-repeat-containing protein [Hungatella sp.]
MEGRMATPCNAEKKNYMEPGGEQEEELYVSATEVLLPEPYRRRYTFMEWNTEPDGSGECYMAGEVVRITEMTLYAVWEKDETESMISVETATASNAKRATSSNGERMKTEEMKKASGQDQDTEPEEKTNTKMDRITEAKRATESNAGRMEIWEEPVTEPEVMEEVCENQK